MQVGAAFGAARETNGLAARPLKDESRLNQAANLCRIAVLITEHVTGRIAHRLHERSFAAHKKVLVLVSWGQRNRPGITARTIQEIGRPIRRTTSGANTLDPRREEEV